MRCTKLFHLYVACNRGNMDSTLAEQRAVLTYLLQKWQNRFLFLNDLKIGLEVYVCHVASFILHDGKNDVQNRH